MGVDFYTCDHCAATFPDCGPYARCESCNQKLCPRCMREFAVDNPMADVANDPDYQPESDDDDCEYDQCPFCANLVVSDDSLLEFALEQLCVSKEVLIERYKAASKEDDSI